MVMNTYIPNDAFIKPRIELAHQILDGIPEAQLNLRGFYQTSDRTKLTNTIACGAGWLGLHPYWQSLGLRRRGHNVMFVGTSPELLSAQAGYLAMAELLVKRVYVETSNRSTDFVKAIFTSRHNSQWDSKLLSWHDHSTSDKTLLLDRLAYAYYQHCEETCKPT